MGERTGVNMVLVGKPEGKRPLERRRRRWDNIIKMVSKSFLFSPTDALCICLRVH